MTTINSRATAISKFAGDGTSITFLANDMVVEVEPISAIKEPERETRKITDRAVSTAEAILNQCGQVAPIIVQDDGTIIAGLEFFRAARKLGWKSIKIVRLSALSKEHARVLTIALARLPELSSWEPDALRLEFNDLLSIDLGFDLHDLTGFTIGEMDVILEGDDPGDNPDPLDEVPDVPEEESIVTQPGDIWQLGEHRIICGNSLDAATYVRLMAEKVARMVLVDPPYNVAIENNVSGLGKKKHKNFAMAVGEMNFAQFTVFLKTMLLHSARHLTDGGLLYVFMDRRKLEELHVAGREAGLSLFDLAVWNKMSGAMGSFYRSQLEICLIFKNGTAPHLNNIELGKHGRYRTNVWDHRGFSSFGKERGEALKQHPTQKPVNLLAETIKDCSKRGEIVLDSFLGSGSTIIAAEKSGRVGYGVELEPKYVDVCIKRFEKMTGKEAVHEATGLTFAQLGSRRLRQPALRQQSNEHQPEVTGQ